MRLIALTWPSMLARRAPSASCCFISRSSGRPPTTSLVPTPGGGVCPGGDLLEACSARRTTTRAFRCRRAALTTHEHAGRIGVDLFVGLRVERRLPAAVIAHLVARASGSRDQSEADEADHDEDERERIH